MSSLSKNISLCLIAGGIFISSNAFADNDWRRLQVVKVNGTTSYSLVPIGSDGGGVDASYCPLKKDGGLDTSRINCYRPWTAQDPNCHFDYQTTEDRIRDMCLGKVIEITPNPTCNGNYYGANCLPPKPVEPMTCPTGMHFDPVYQCVGEKLVAPPPAPPAPNVVIPVIPPAGPAAMLAPQGNIFGGFNVVLPPAVAAPATTAPAPVNTSNGGALKKQSRE